MCFTLFVFDQIIAFATCTEGLTAPRRKGYLGGILQADMIARPSRHAASSYIAPDWTWCRPQARNFSSAVQHVGAVCPDGANLIDHVVFLAFYQFLAPMLIMRFLVRIPGLFFLRNDVVS